MRITFLIPAYNEAGTIAAVIARLGELGLERQIVVVDDGSADDTAAVAQAAFVPEDHGIVIRKANGGKGSALRAGIPHVDGDIVVIQDADLEYDPADIPGLIEPIVRDLADVVYGSRLSGGRPQRAYLFWHLMGNRFLSLLTGVLYNTTLSDMETGYKAFTADVIRSLDLHQDHFGIEPEITAQVCKKKLRIYEVPVSYYGRTYEEGKKITWKDGFTAVLVLLRERVRP